MSGSAGARLMTCLIAIAALEMALVLSRLIRSVAIIACIVTAAARIVATVVQPVLSLLFGLSLLLNAVLFDLFDIQAIKEVIKVRGVIWPGRANPVVLFLENTVEVGKAMKEG